MQSWRTAGVLLGTLTLATLTLTSPAYANATTAPPSSPTTAVETVTPEVPTVDQADPAKGAPAQQAKAKAAPGDCEAYVYDGTKQNLCDRFRGRGDVNCPEIGYRVKLVGDSDPWRLDIGGEPGIGCESYKRHPGGSTPTKPKPTKSTTPGASGGGDSGGAQLPRTGINGGVLAGVGLGAVLLGAGGLVVARRRRPRFTA
ncbi:LPXTG cell wall anchor domain-containing protein [Micromonospora sp. NPDC004551]|uniref:LPXTG cell wall anchor domain-containing protein n=1 Tax=Micromonospora sp. NPDC004551 TaxID=3154284 RepID=UPI0033B48D09